MASEANQPQDSYEPSPTSAPPSDVEIPVESIYGDNVAMEPPKVSGEAKEGAPSSKSDPSSSSSNSKSGTKRKSSDSEARGGKSIKIGFIPFLLLMLCLGAGIFVLGNKFKVSIKDGSAQIEQADFKTKLPETTENETSEESQNGDNEPSSTDKKQKRTLNFLRDLGLYKRENSYTASELAGSRLRLAKKTIIWVTSEPNNEKMLSLLTAIKNKSPIPIFIVTGGETSQARIKPALDAGFSVSKLTSTLELPYSILVIDDKILMDISREHWIWETTEKDIISQTAQWANELLKNAKLLNNTIE